MRDIYLYEGTDVLKNLLNIRDRKKLDEAEADYVTYRLKEIAKNQLPGNYDYFHLLRMHEYIFQDIYEWAGQQRKLNIYKEEDVLGGLSIDYSDIFDVRTALVAYNAVFDDLGNLSKPEYLIRIVEDAISRGK